MSGGLRKQIENKLVHYPGKGKEAAVPGVSSASQIHVFNCAAVNNSGATAMVGVCRKLAQQSLKLYSLASAVYTELDLDNLSGGLQIFTGNSGDGFVVGSIYEPNLVGVTVSTAAAGGTYAIQYYNGSSFVALPSMAALETAADYNAVGDRYNVFQAPVDMVRGGPAGLDQNLYYMQVVDTGPVAGPIEIDDLWAASFLTLFNEVENGQAASVSFDWRKPFPLDGSQNLIPYFASPNANNRVSTFFSTVG